MAHGAIVDSRCGYHRCKMCEAKQSKSKGNPQAVKSKADIINTVVCLGSKSGCGVYHTGTALILYRLGIKSFISNS